MIHKYLGKATQEIAESLETDCMVFVRKDSSDDPIFSLTVVREKKGNISREIHEIEIKKLPPSSVTQIREILIEAVNNGFISKGEKVFVITDDSLGTGFEGLMFISKIDDKFMELTTKKLEESIDKTVYDTTLDIAREIAKEGREGHHVGTAFIVGDHDNVLAKSKQLILNPLEGHPISERNVMSTDFRETIKELSQLDGVFVLSEDGTVESACRYLKCDISNINFPGLGTRHHACAAMTKITNSAAIVVSESGGKIRVFKDGNIVHEESI